MFRCQVHPSGRPHHTPSQKSITYTAMSKYRGWLVFFPFSLSAISVDHVFFGADPHSVGTHNVFCSPRLMLPRLSPNLQQTGQEAISGVSLNSCFQSCDRKWNVRNSNFSIWKIPLMFLPSTPVSGVYSMRSNMTIHVTRAEHISDIHIAISFKKDPGLVASHNPSREICRLLSSPLSALVTSLVL